MFVELLILWVIFNGRITVEILLFGVGISSGICLILNKISGRNMFFAHRFIFHKVKGRLAYYFVLLKEIIKANIQVIDVILTPGDVEVAPVLHEFETNIESEELNILLANSITLTPGTITAEIDGNKLRVLALDDSFMDGIEESVFVKELEKLDKENK